jgi:hypothetical protein
VSWRQFLRRINFATPEVIADPYAAYNQLRDRLPFSYVDPPGAIPGIMNRFGAVGLTSITNGEISMQDKPVALVTGANQGIGLQIAKGLVAHGFTVLVGSRNLERGEAAARTIN